MTELNENVYIYQGTKQKIIFQHHTFPIVILVRTISNFDKKKLPALVRQRRAVCKPPDPAHAHPHDDNVSILDCALRSKISSFFMEGSGLWEWDHYGEERADKSGCQSAVKVNPTGYCGTKPYFHQC